MVSIKAKTEICLSKTNDAWWIFSYGQQTTYHQLCLVKANTAARQNTWENQYYFRDKSNKQYVLKNDVPMADINYWGHCPHLWEKYINGWGLYWWKYPSISGDENRERVELACRKFHQSIRNFTSLLHAITTFKTFTSQYYESTKGVHCFRLTILVSLPFLEEIIPFVIYDNESREIFYFHSPDGFHT